MKKLLFLAFVIISCKTVRNEISNREDFSNQKSIKYLTKSWDNEVYTTFLKENLEKNESLLKYKDKAIFKEKSDYEYFYEIFDKNFLIISIKKKSNWSWSSPETVTKDSVYIIDLSSRKKSFISLKRTNFARRIIDMQDLYHYSKQTLINDEFTYHYAIESIDIDKNEMYLIQPNLSVKKYELTIANYNLLD